MGQIANEMLFKGILKIADDVKYKKLLENAKKHSIVLASNSPRRRELLSEAGIDFVVDVSDVDETTDKNIPSEVVMYLSKIKARAVAKRHPGEVILAADTIVALGDKILGKPTSEADALDTLESLMGEKHQVYTGVTIIGKDGTTDSFFESTDVVMRESTKEELLDYIHTGEPMDKAGSYAIQGIGGKFVTGIEGDYDNVVGLPVRAVIEHLAKL